MGAPVNQSVSRPLIVELIGTPGAGKSTFLPAVKEYFKLQGMQPWLVIEAARPFAERTPAGKLIRSWAPQSWRGPLLWQVFYQSSKACRAAFREDHRTLIDSTLDFQHRRPITPADREHVLHWFINLTGQYTFLKEHWRAGEVLIFDEGFVHRVVQLFASEVETVEPARVHAYLDMVPVPDLIIQPVASTETCLERVYLRGVWERFKNRDKAAVARFVANAHKAVDIAVEHIIAEGWPILRVPNDNRPASESIHELSAQLWSRYGIPANGLPVPANA